METKANYAIVGLFTLVVLLLAFGFVYWMSAYGREGKMDRLIVRIPGSANGLSVGSAVRFNGIPVGTVRALDFDRNDPRYSLAVTEIRADSPVYPTTRAVLEIQGLTGAAYIELSGGNTKDERLIETAAKQGKAAMLLAEQSGVTNIVATASEIMNKTDKTLVQLQGFVNDNRRPLTEAISNADVFTRALKDNAKGIDEFLQAVTSLSGTLKTVSGKVDSVLTTVDALLKAVDAKKIDAILANAEKVSKDLADASGGVAKAVDTFNKTAEAYRVVGDKAAKTLDRVDTLMAAVNPDDVKSSMSDIRAAVADARQAVQTFRGVASDIEQRRPDIDKTIQNISEMSAKLNKASSRVDGVLAKVDSFLGTGDSSSLFADARATLQSFKQVADNLNAKIGPIADNLARFSGSGLKNVDALISDTRRTVQNLDSAITKLDDNPSRLLFGGDEVKTYNGRVRH